MDRITGIPYLVEDIKQVLPHVVLDESQGDHGYSYYRGPRSSKLDGQFDFTCDHPDTPFERCISFENAGLIYGDNRNPHAITLIERRPRSNPSDTEPVTSCDDCIRRFFHS